MKLRRPILTDKVVRGLQDLRSLAASEIEAGDRGSFDRSNGGPGDQDAKRAVRYLDDLIHWWKEPR